MNEMWRDLKSRWEAYRESRGLFSAGNRAFKRGEFEAAAALYAQTLEKDEDHNLARFNLGLALYKSGSRREARAQWKIVLERVEGKNEYLAEQTRIMLRQFG